MGRWFCFVRESGQVGASHFIIEQEVRRIDYFFISLFHKKVFARTDPGIGPLRPILSDIRMSHGRKI